ncbi:RDD family protein [Wolbachia endosymbiont of Cylisticus convexus]|uniref:RDD family protein n=1 Tax=Wolbachia endosymbiont of Cylisticus convexus TaxID=118728 RepID=UPI0015D05086|nr:RDD family protein [Wolbachia endosymbiont of Cylisticus convexus]
MDTETDVKVNYAGLIKRIAAGILDFIIFLSPLLVCIIFGSLFGLLGEFSDDDSFSQTDEQLEHIMVMAMPIVLMITITLVPVVFEILMITKLGGTPGKLLCDMRVKSTNTFKNATLIQAAIRSICKVIFLFILPCLTYIFCVFLLDLGLNSNLDSILTIIAIMLIFICARFDQRKQTFYDKIANTVVVYYKPS